MSIMAIDQYGVTEHDLGAHPRAELLRRTGYKRADKMFVDRKADGHPVHVGYVIGGRWFTLYNVTPWERDGAETDAA